MQFVAVNATCSFNYIQCLVVLGKYFPICEFSGFLGGHKCSLLLPGFHLQLLLSLAFRSQILDVVAMSDG